jgi:hypothetical protein
MRTRQEPQTALAVVFFVLGLVGGVVHWRHDRRSFWFYGPLVFTVTLVLVYYMNFKYGASQAPELGETVQREVRDRDYFYLWSSRLGECGLRSDWWPFGGPLPK